MPLQATSGAASYDAFGGGVAAVPQYIEDVFSTYLYTGNGTSLTVTNNIDLSTKGGLVWLKSRSTAGTHHTLFDSARGANKFLFTDLTDAQTTDSGQTLNTTGFTIGNNSDINTSAATYASWTFRKQPKFFDVVTYTGNGSVQNIAHNLGSAPGCIIVKATGFAENWFVYHTSTGATQALTLNTTQAADSTLLWNNTAPTSTQFTVRSVANSSGETYVAYLFAHNAGGFGLTGTDNVISCGSFTTDGSTNATVDLGYEPQWMMLKRSDGAGDWSIQDNMRLWTVGNSSGQNVSLLYPNQSVAENYGGTPSANPKLTNTGFKVESYGAGRTYIYIAIRRGPMKVPTSGTSVFSPSKTTTTNASSTVVTTNFPVDLTITKDVASGTNNLVYDRLRGSSYTSARELVTNATTAEASRGYGLGFDNNTGYRQNVYNNNETVAWWNFRRAPSFFDVVCYTGNGVNARAITHNLGVAPEMIIVKKRTGADGWVVWASGLTSRLYELYLNDPRAQFVEASPRLNVNNAPTSTQFEVGTDGEVNASGATYVSYLFATCAGVSKVFSYTGNGSSQTINCGFTAGARWVLIKRTDSTGDWYVWDSARGIVSGNDPHLSLNTTAAEVTTDDTIDTDSTGFVVNQVSATNVNVSSATYIGIAIA